MQKILGENFWAKFLGLKFLIMYLTQTLIKDVFIIKTHNFQDARGVFSRVYSKNEYGQIMNEQEIVQINHSLSFKKGTIRGMHYQIQPYAETKIIRCIRGSVFDVVVDLRQYSPTFLSWISVNLNDFSNNAIIIPPGCAHGFQALNNNVELIYLHTSTYNPEYEAAVRFDDPRIKILWPLTPTNISERDLSHKLIDKNFVGVKI